MGVRRLLGGPLCVGNAVSRGPKMLSQRAQHRVSVKCTAELQLVALPIEGVE